MFTLDRFRNDFLDQDAAVRRALEATDRGLFDVDEDYEDADEAAGRPVRRQAGQRRSQT